MIDCREAVRRMWAYIDHVLEARPVAELEAHLDTCRRCCGELEFQHQLRALVAEGTPAPDGPGGTQVPPELRARIDVLIAGMDATEGGSA